MPCTLRAAQRKRRYLARHGFDALYPCEAAQAEGIMRDGAECQVERQKG